MFRLFVITTSIALIAGLAGASHASAQAEAATTWAYCFSTDTRQCSVAGRHYLEGTGGAQVTPSWAQLAWQHGCEHEDGESCRELGHLHDQGRIVAQSNERAYQLFGRGCQLGSMNSCHEQARMLRLGRGVGTNVSEANRLDGWACDHGSSAACVQMANVYAQGQGVERDPAESRRLLQRACELGDAAACLGSLAGAVAAAATGEAAPAPQQQQQQRRR
ncbi:MAG: sel1 repeat family protein, partial [Gammaproteobacteria bacterium]|nr:sel1 repeat family protein [Gammaproteobacteria bacterium]